MGESRVLEQKARRAASKDLNFEVSTGLKKVLGRELITDDEVAIFELVKNSFDADAKTVQLHFESDSIYVIDDGYGMSYEDINKKWLFVAYSAKRGTGGYRDQVAERQHYAGSKGIGRFSSDRLGKTLVLQTRPDAPGSGKVNRVKVDWDLFEKDDLRRFETIPVSYATTESFDLPTSLSEPDHGTAIEIRTTRTKWDRVKILHLKSSLAKLINPFGADVDRFKILVSAPEQIEDDRVVSEKAGGEPIPANDIVNGEVGNFVFSELRAKTTFIEVFLDNVSDTIETRLTDRGELVYKVKENNPYKHLSSSSFKCELYYLNRSAKVTFARRTGLPSVQFGSVFLFRNGFRVFPIGEEGDDWFGIDRRKQQGYARFLGTRDVIGRIDVSGDDADFQEASSRNQGLIKTPAVDEIRKCFREHCLMRLEKYVVPVSWVDKGEADASDLSRLLTDPGRARVAAAVASLVDNKDIQLLDYSRKLIGLLNERSEQFENSLVSLRRIAEETKDSNLLGQIEGAEKRFEELKRSEAEARRVADAEREAKEEAEKRAEEAEAAAADAEEQLEEEKKRNLFLTSVTSLDTDTILNMHHQITIYAADMGFKLENFIAEIGKSKSVPRDKVLSALEQIAFLNRKIQAISKFATKANFRLESDKIAADLAKYIADYIEKVAREFAPSGLRLITENDHPGFETKFKPIDVSVVVDNLISNAKKARASEVSFKLSQPRKNVLRIDVADNGRGIASKIDKERLFEKGYTSTDGSGLGLYHVRQVLGEMGGSVRVGEAEGKGAAFVIEVTKK